MPATHRDGPILLNVNRFLDMPQALAMAAERIKVHTTDSKEAMTYAAAVAEKLKW